MEKKADIKPKKIKSSQSEDDIILKSAKLASLKAVRSSIALGLTVKRIKNNQIIELRSGEQESVIRDVVRAKINTGKLKKGIVLKKKCISHD